MARQKMVSISKIGDIIDLMKSKGVYKLSIPDTINIEIFPFAVETDRSASNSIDSEPFLSENEMTDDELLLHSSR